MHEMTLLRDLLRKIELIAAQEEASRVVGVKVRIGALAHISGEHFREHFEQATEGHVAEDAELEVVEMTDESDPLAQEIVLESIQVQD
ncbi:hydrogenase maturation nickel metallochaperone HypA [Persicimonas caeni]|uniref:Hydrogenase maturation nickel metallochaperone HypA n=2 Tax=Persicimonas caeni TaxID=2292766 RepID=A0A4Y6PML1_PERCE|nr:hydrogenase maturation nickel metallochaperone HypA [Persicimonas caeni]QED30759.1 hydrogenase maturation nickel metallochaperone HypA [Persicimonas caeni]